ncbi:MAG: hypothetical protein ACFFFB_09855 [Candidatus Heimdallarchaeota archaeon]
MQSSEKLIKISSILLIIGCVQFLILTAIAMIFYRGGTYINSSSLNYSFWLNFFSDLGRTVAHSGLSNTISFIIFTFTLSSWGILQIPFYIVFIRFFIIGNNKNKLSIAGSICGVINGILYVAIALTPSDILGPPHNIFVVIGFSSIFLSNFFYFIVIVKNRNYNNVYGVFLIISAIIIVIYSVLIIFHDSRIPEGLLVFVSGQKIMIYSLLLCGIVQGIGALKQIHSGKILKKNKT